MALVVFLMVVSTAHYKLGLLASISRGYKKTFVLMALVWFVATSTRIARNVRDFMGEASDGGGERPCRLHLHLLHLLHLLHHLHLLLHLRLYHLGCRWLLRCCRRLLLRCCRWLLLRFVIA